MGDDGANDDNDFTIFLHHHELDPTPALPDPADLGPRSMDSPQRDSRVCGGSQPYYTGAVRPLRVSYTY